MKLQPFLLKSYHNITRNRVVVNLLACGIKGQSSGQGLETDLTDY